MNPNTRKKLRAVFKAAILGAILFIVIGLVCGLIRSHTERGTLWNDLSEIVAFILFFPVMLILSAFGLQNTAEHMSGYVVYALCGAVIFAILAFIWKFIVKGNHEK